ncbi:hypothetical protein RRG08_059653 [Elysia crispata]|uniref:Uncharacterized protein n=1 Tax=Elysia crispata TaxID=231223 RepID=A0AAE1EA87_9GAST|nr:hypothetical protein RRG08_059653 [Elysia crispata]
MFPLKWTVIGRLCLKGGHSLVNPVSKVDTHWSILPQVWTLIWPILSQRWTIIGQSNPAPKVDNHLSILHQRWTLIVQSCLKGGQLLVIYVSKVDTHCSIPHQRWTLIWPLLSQRWTIIWPILSQRWTDIDQYCFKGGQTLINTASKVDRH